METFPPSVWAQLTIGGISYFTPKLSCFLEGISEICREKKKTNFCDLRSDGPSVTGQRFSLVNFHFRLFIFHSFISGWSLSIFFFALFMDIVNESCHISPEVNICYQSRPWGWATCPANSFGTDRIEAVFFFFFFINITMWVITYFHFNLDIFIFSGLFVWKRGPNAPFNSTKIGKTSWGKKSAILKIRIKRKSQKILELVKLIRSDKKQIGDFLRPGVQGRRTLGRRRRELWEMLEMSHVVIVVVAQVKLRKPCTWNECASMRVNYTLIKLI